MGSNEKTPWLYNLKTDLFFILLPLFLPLIIIYIFPDIFIYNNESGIVSWVLLVLLIDVSHVYSTLYRTYMDRGFYRQNKVLLILVPLFCWVFGAFLYQFNSKLFWSAIAYFAVFHFVRQQYGFMRLYSRKEIAGKLSKTTDSLAIYAATIYPLIYWHTHTDRNFYWFVKGDFFIANSAIISQVFFIVYLIIQIAFLTQIIMIYAKSKTFNFPKFLLWLGTSLSWYIGIIILNGDLTFTFTNIVAHGIPYIALIWIYTKKKIKNSETSFSPYQIKNIFQKQRYLMFLIPLFLLAFTEELLWDSLIWRDAEHSYIFGIFYFFPKINTKELLAICIPLLTVPQLTHYILDGFIWKVKKDNL